MDEVFDRSLAEFATEPWWSGFISTVHQSYNNFAILPELFSSPLNRTLYWALNTAVEILDTSDLGRKESILAYVNTDGGISNFFDLFSQLGATIPVGVKISALIREFVNPRNGKFRHEAVKQMIQAEPLSILFKIIETVRKDSLKSNERDSLARYHVINVNTIWIISSLAKKDIKFVHNLLELDKLKYTHDFIKRHFFHPKCEIHFPSLKILRVLSKNSKVGHMLGKDKIFSTLKKMMEAYISSPSTKFQIILELVVILTKNSKAQCKRLLKAGCLVTLIRVFGSWHIWKGKGLLRMTKCILNIYLQLASTYSGRRALLQADALHAVRIFCENCPADKQFDEVITRACSVNSLVYGKHKLPFKDLFSPAKFEFTPQGKIPKDSSTESDEDGPGDGDELVEKDDKNQGGEDDDEDEGEDIDQEVIISDVEPGSDEEISIKKSTTKVKVPKIRLNGPDDCIETSVPYEGSKREKIVDCSEFFKEFDWKHLSAPSCYNTKVYESIVVGLLGKFIPKEVVTTVPKAQYNSNMDGKISREELHSTYLTVSNQVRTVIPFVKVAYPELTLAYGGKRIEGISSNTDRFLLRDKVIKLMQRTAGVGVSFKPVVVYDLDSLINRRTSTVGEKGDGPKIRPKTPISIPGNKLGNDDELNIGVFENKKKHSLRFESRFEGGNLRKAVQINEREYDLYLMSDVNSNKHNQWFYFQVSNTPEDGAPITFNIVNCIKTNSQFNFGMQPVLFSVMEAVEGRGGWVRGGSNVMYYRNGFRNAAGKRRKYYYSATFTINFSKRGDIVYIAYHYPYSYSRLLTELWKMTKLADDEGRVLVRYDMLCHSENENEVPLMTITALNEPNCSIDQREIIFLSSRVHPGEPNSSWVMHGILHQLLFGKGIEEILRRYIFKVIPMLNVEGVINGCGRCGLTNEDLNRRWKSPDPSLHPSIYYSKALIEYSCKIKNKVPVLYCDLHGHSRRKNVFLYGCSLAKSWSSEDRVKPEDPHAIQRLPEAMSRRAPAFSLSYCNFDIRKQREATARVALWREFGIQRSYTLESSYCGCDQGPYKGISLGIAQLIEVGETLIESCEDLYKEPLATSASMFNFSTDFENYKTEELRKKSEFSSSDVEPSRYSKPLVTTRKMRKTRSNRIRLVKTKSGRHRK